MRSLQSSENCTKTNINKITNSHRDLKSDRRVLTNILGSLKLVLLLFPPKEVLLLLLITVRDDILEMNKSVLHYWRIIQDLKYYKDFLDWQKNIVLLFYIVCIIPHSTVLPSLLPIKASVFLIDIPRNSVRRCLNFKM